MGKKKKKVEGGGLIRGVGQEHWTSMIFSFLLHVIF